MKRGARWRATVLLRRPPLPSVTSTQRRHKHKHCKHDRRCTCKNNKVRTARRHARNHSISTAATTRKTTAPAPAAYSRKEFEERPGRLEGLGSNDGAANSNDATTPCCKRHIESTRILCTVRFLSFGHMAQCAVHALKSLACCARVTLASSPASHCKQCSCSRSLRSTRAAAPVLLAHAEVTKMIYVFNGSKT